MAVPQKDNRIELHNRYQNKDHVSFHTISNSDVTEFTREHLQRLAQDAPPAFDRIPNHGVYGMDTSVWRNLQRKPDRIRQEGPSMEGFWLTAHTAHGTEERIAELARAIRENPQIGMFDTEMRSIHFHQRPDTSQLVPTFIRQGPTLRQEHELQRQHDFTTSHSTHNTSSQVGQSKKRVLAPNRKGILKTLNKR